MHTQRSSQRSLLLQSFGASHQGCVREDNQDDFLRRDEAGLWAIADGVGGLSHGQYASRTVIAALNGLSPVASLHAAADALTRAVAQANFTLIDYAAAQQAQLGTTLVALLIRGETFLCAWAGDSRLYCLRGERLTQVTQDHNEANTLMAQGILTPDEAARWPRRNVITRALGVDAEMTLEFRDGTVRDGDIFLLCSDGLTAHLSDADIAAGLSSKTLDKATEKLIQTALERGGSDNVTVIAVSAQRMANDREKTVIMIPRKAPHG